MITGILRLPAYLQTSDLLGHRGFARYPVFKRSLTVPNARDTLRLHFNLGEVPGFPCSTVGSDALITFEALRKLEPLAYRRVEAEWLEIADAQHRIAPVTLQAPQSTLELALDNIVCGRLLTASK